MQAPTFKEWTVGDLKQMLSLLPDTAKIRLEDADTFWTIKKIDVQFEIAAQELWFYPSDYSEMTR